MKNRAREVDAYIAKAPAYSKPILEKVRRSFHKACPDLEETIKWGFPHFEYKGMLGSMAAFKKHVAFGFWKGTLMSDPENLFKGVGRTSMVQIKVSAPSQLPPDKVLLSYIKEAVELNEMDVKVPPARRKAVRKEAEVPDDLAEALNKNRKAMKTFEQFSASDRREYVEWVAQARAEATRKKRLATAIEWMAEGKPRNWKYMKEWR